MREHKSIGPSLVPLIKFSDVPGVSVLGFVDFLTNYRFKPDAPAKTDATMQFLVKLLRDLARDGDETQVMDILVACDLVLQRESMQDRELVEEIVTLCNKRLVELRGENNGTR